MPVCIPRPKVSVLLCTVRGDQGYRERPDWTTLGKVVDDLSQQTFHDFELIIVDGLHSLREAPRAEFPVVHVGPRPTLWTKSRKAAISTYRNTGLTYCRGELVINIDDCVELPPKFLDFYVQSYFGSGVCVAATWAEHGDTRLQPGQQGRLVQREGEVYGLGSYPLELACRLNGYDEAFDGSMYLEDVDWGIRLYKSGLQMGLVHIPGFRLPPQSGHDPRAIDPVQPIVKCCNMAWQVERVERCVIEANRAELWRNRATLERLVGPCHYLRQIDGTCAHHRFMNKCEYLHTHLFKPDGDDGQKSFALHRHPLAAKFLDAPPVFDLRLARKEVGIDA